MTDVRCLYCGAHRTQAGVCKGCGAEAASVACRQCQRPVPAPLDRCQACGTPCMAWADARGQELRCPRCSGRLERVAVSGVHVEQCARCLGCFVRAEDFAELLQQEESGQHVNLAFTSTDGRSLPRQALLALVRCPHCPREMDRARFDQRAELVIDICASHGMWLDAGELTMVLQYVHDRAAGHAPTSAAAREEQEHWDRVDQALANEARIVDAHLANAARPAARSSPTSVVVATAVGGPWLGLAVAMRGLRKR